MINAAIIEDELLAINRLKSMLSVHPDISILWQAQTAESAIDKLKMDKPDLLFLDIHLPDRRGFYILKELKFQPYVIFTTAYAQYALEAFKTMAIDYLVKPYSQEQLNSAIQKYKRIQDAKQPKTSIKWEEINTLFQKKNITTLSIKDNDRIKLIDLDTIAYISAEDKYSRVYLVDSTKIFTDYSLKDLESRLNNSFLRIHRSHIINTNQVKELRKGFKKRYSFHFSHKINNIQSATSYYEDICAYFSL